jgi:soluble lytic murein transglycosylase-like protein
MKAAYCALALTPLWLAGCAPISPPEASLARADAKPTTPLDERIAYYAERYDVPESLVRRSIVRESGYNPNAHHGPYWGLMQIRLDTARSLGYQGNGRGLLDADANLKYATAYLANAYVVAGADDDRALRLYASGYFWEARRKGMLDQLKKAEDYPEPGGQDSPADTQVATKWP